MDFILIFLGLAAVVAGAVVVVRNNADLKPTEQERRDKRRAKRQMVEFLQPKPIDEDPASKK